jgi:predicted Zn-dependent protease
MTMKCRPFLWLNALCWIFVLSCQTVPITGREQLRLVSSQQIRAMGVDAYQEFLSKNDVIRGTAEAQQVNRVGIRIKSAVEKYFAERNMSAQLSGYAWEFNLIKDSNANAWAMPGGKVAVYTGILPITRDDQGLAVVMGHEIAHVVANHGNERMSQALLAQMGGMALSAALSEQPAQTQKLFAAAFGLGTQVGILLPYSRLQESEADHLGLIFMAMAGYDPREAVDFWQRMATEKEGGSPPEFLSTHPTSASRIQNIRSLLPEAMNYYRG